jgi:hypothetical protein
MARHKEFLLILGGASVTAFLVSLFFLHPALAFMLIAPGAVGGACARIWGWKGIGGIAVFSALCAACGYVGVPILFLLGALPIAFGLWTRREDASDP